MKTCPYCAEEVQDEAVLCKHCRSDLRAAVAQAVAASAPAAAPTLNPPAQSTANAKEGKLSPMAMGWGTGLVAIVAVVIRVALSSSGAKAERFVGHWRWQIIHSKQQLCDREPEEVRLSDDGSYYYSVAKPDEHLNSVPANAETNIVLAANGTLTIAGANYPSQFKVSGSTATVVPYTPFTAAGVTIVEDSDVMTLNDDDTITRTKRTEGTVSDPGLACRQVVMDITSKGTRE